MTNEQAIEVLKTADENASCDNCLYGYENDGDCEHDECPIMLAILMAINALEQEPLKPHTLEYHEVYMKGWNEGRRKLVDAMEKEIAI